MGRKSPALKDRIWAAYNLIRYGKGKLRCMTCGKCGSIVIQSISDTPVEGKIEDVGKRIDMAWVDMVRCSKCGAICEEIQLWNFEGDPKKVDASITVKYRNSETKEE